MVNLVVIDAHLHLWNTGVVAWVPLDQPDEAAAQLDRLQTRPGFAGIRNLIHDQPDPDWLLRPAVGEALALLEGRGIPFDVISGLYPPDPSWTAADLRDVVEFAVELFGPDRLMFGSDWPVAELGGGYAKVTAELFTLIGQLHPAGREAVLGGTARRFYALPDTPAGPGTS